MSQPSDDLHMMTRLGQAFLPGHLGIEITGVGEGWLSAALDVKPHLMAPNGFLHAGTVVSLADTVCGYGCVRARPEGAHGFTTIELKSNFTGTARDGRIEAKGQLVHGGRMTQLWDATVWDVATEKQIAHFRCTQMILYPKS